MSLTLKDKLRPTATVTHVSADKSLQHLFESFRLLLQSNFKSMMADFKADIHSLVATTEQVGEKMARFAKSHNTLIDSHSSLEEEVSCLSAKVLDLEDH